MTIALIATAVLSPALWKIGERIINAIFRRNKEKRLEIKNDSIAFRQYLLDQNDKLSAKFDEVSKKLDDREELIDKLKDEITALQSEVKSLRLELEYYRPRETS